MNNLRNRVSAIFAFLTIISMNACGVGGDTGGSSGGGGFGGGSFAGDTNTGQIVGFGSIIVNGIEFSRKTGLADNRVKLGFDNISGASEERLQVGMVVKVKGTFNSATGKGEYESIEFQPELRGRLDEVNDAAGTVQAMGRTVQIEPNTQFGNLRDLAELATALAGGLHPELEVSGNLDGNGILHATRISRVALDFANNSRVEIKGAIETVGTGTFTIGGVTVNTAGATFANMTAADIAVALLVEVKGTFNTTTNTITNARIEKKRAVEAEADDKVLVKGIAAGTIANDSFTLNGPNGAITVKSAAAAFSKNGVAATSAIVTAGTLLQVEGSLDASGAVVATKVAVEIEKTVKLLGIMSAKDGTAGTLTVNGVKLTVVPPTRFIDSSSARLSPFTLADLIANVDHVGVAGFVDAAGKVIAAQVERFDSQGNNRTFIQGPVSDKTANTMTILGITVTVGAGTRFENPDKTPFTGGPTAFIGAIVPNVTVVKARGTFTATGGLDATTGEVQLNQLP
ncbi:MAG: hypothetical protein FD174_340 [Geobacteraceae bacterium]|nr:MAG: hypothetical protein FD174_340 [Geobacteraceae bacterium]